MRAGFKCLRQAGFTLLEVLITLVVLGAGLISLAKFQGTVLQDNDLAKTRSVAAQLAEERIEQFRSFRVLDAVTGAALGLSAYQSIASDSTGENITVSNVAYTRTWAVVDFCFPIARNSPADNVSSPTVDCRRRIPDFKNVTVTVAWNDQDGNPRDVSLATSISAVDPAYSGRVIQISGERSPGAGSNEIYPPSSSP